MFGNGRGFQQGHPDLPPLKNYIEKDVKLTHRSLFSDEEPHSPIKDYPTPTLALRLVRVWPRIALNDC